MSGTAGAPERRTGPSTWQQDGDAFVLTTTVSSMRDTLAPWFLVTTAAFAVAAAAVAVLSGAGTVVAIMLGVFVFAGLTSIVAIMRLALAARPLTMRIEQDRVTVIDGSAGAVTAALVDVQRLCFVHDGAPSRIRYTTSDRAYRWTIGQLYRHNTVQEFVPAVPPEAVAWLAAAGLHATSTVRRRVRTTEFRRA